MQLTVYAQAKQALAEYKTVDEVKDFRDKAVAVEAYAKQANDYELENDAALARVRAERKCGELLRDMNLVESKLGNLKHVKNTSRSSGATSIENNKTLNEMGVSKDQSSKWQKLAAIPEDEFEAAVNVKGAKPSTNQLIKSKEDKKPEKEIKRMDDDALWLWSTLREMRDRNIFRKEIFWLENEWTDGMKKDVNGLIPQLRGWINE